MSTKSARQEILNSLDAEYTSDLAIHLYSTFLLRRINPLFPKHEWSYWPLPIEEVPIPKDNYEDNTIKGYKEDIDLWQEKYNKSLQGWIDQYNHKRKKPKNVTKIDISTDYSSDGDDSSSSSSGSSDDDDEEEEEHLEEIDIREKIIQVEYKDKIINSKKILSNSISSILQSKIELKIKKLKELGEIDQILESSDKIFENPILNPIINQISNRFNNMLDNLTSVKRSNNWQQVLLSSLKSETNPYSQLNTNMYRDLYSKCDKLFNDIDYKFEFEEHEIDDDDDDSEDDSEEEQEEDKDKYKHVISSNGAFNVIEYLKLLAEETNLKKYNDLVDKYPKEFNQRKQEQDKLKNSFFGALDIQDQYKNISYDNYSDIQTKRKRRRRLNPDKSNIEEVLDDILGSTELNENSYKLLNL